MERSEPTPVLPIVSTSHAHLAAHVNLRRNKMMLPKFYHNKALRGSSTKTPPERRYHRNRDLLPKHSGARAQKLPPRDAIVAIAIFHQNTRGLDYKISPRETSSSPTDAPQA